MREGSQKIVYDKFHIAKHLGDAVDKVRRQENRTLRAAGDDRLTGTRYDWLRNPAAMEPADRRAFAELRQSGFQNLLGVEPARDAREVAERNRVETLGDYFDAELAKGWLTQLRGQVTSMVRITVTPQWVGLLDFQTRFPSALAG